MATMTEVAGWMHGEMTRNAVGPIATVLKAYNGSVVTYYDALVLWKAWVGNRRPWDHKLFLRGYYGAWCPDAPSRKDYGFDIWSNLHYGFVGRAVDFSAWTLKAGAGAAQLKAGTSPDGYLKRRLEKLGDADVLAALDDPKDQAAIEVGIALWNAHGTAVTLTEMVDACRKAAPKLNTR